MTAPRTTPIVRSKLDRPRRMTMALITGVLAASLFALPPVAGAQATGVAAVPPLIVFGQERSPDVGASAPGLTHEQAATLEAIRTDPLVSELHVGRSEAAALAAVPVARALSIPVPGSARGAFAFTGVNVVHNAEGMVSLSARDIANDTSVSLVVQGPDILGSIEHGDGTWRVAPLGGGLTAVYRYDTSGLRMDPPGWGMRQKLLAPEPRPMDDAGASVEGTDTGDVIDLMVVYTPAAAALGNIDAFIQFALNNTHEAYRNSNIEFRLRLVHKAQVDYTQHENMGNDLLCLDSPDDGCMDEVHGLRDRYGADLVALLVAGPAGGLGLCGVAWVPDYNKYPTDNFDTWAFSVTGRHCESTNYRVFAHELGHNQGAMHDPYNAGCWEDPDVCFDGENFPWRFGRCNTEQGWRTVMAYQSTLDGLCVQSAARFSSPAVTFRGTPTGDAARRDNRRVLLETARRVANFRQSKTEEPPPPPPPPNSLQATLPYVAPAGGGLHPSLVRVLNDSAQPNTVQVTGYDDTGRRFGPERLSLGAHEATTLTTTDLEAGRSGFAGLGDGEGWWRLELEGERPFRAGMYYRTADRFMAELSAPVAGEEDGGSWRYDVGFFNPGSNTSKVSRLRLANPTDQEAQVVVAGRDDRGREAPEGTVGITLPAQGAATLSARELENGGSGFTGRLGDGAGKWRLTVTADRPVVVMSLLHAVQTGHLANLSAIAQGAQGSAPPPPPPPPPPEAGPDLVVGLPVVDNCSLEAGEAFILSAEVRNQGDAASAATTLRYYRSSDTTISRSDTPVGTAAVGSLSASGTSTESIDLTAPASDGTYYYGACVDAVAGESDSRNNCSSSDAVTVGQPLGYWGAIAAGWTGPCCDGDHGWGAAWDFCGQAAAVSAAEYGCRRAGGQDCRSWVAFPLCGALAYGITPGEGRGLFGGAGATRATAEEDALADCRVDGYSQCSLSTWEQGNVSFCNQGAAGAARAEPQALHGMAESPPGTSSPGSRLVPDRAPRPVVEEPRVSGFADRNGFPLSRE